MEAVVEGLPDGLSANVEPCASIEGWVILANNVHPEATEEDLYEAFVEYGDITNITLNLDRQTGLVKGYAFLEFKEREHAAEAIAGMNQRKMLGQPLVVDWTFVNPEPLIE